VFLSNRVYPTMSNNKLGEKDIRTIIHNLIYEAIID
jgi:beta-N-acetylhexosaminidase